jgi:hypothetical protein
MKVFAELAVSTAVTGSTCGIATGTTITTIVGPALSYAHLESASI